ncbi:hypothetical protein DSM112329_02990 [Paraconexibacter sp. AEG42_29]|uniref:PAS domain-containing protein n=1 Tax=Paraconexibacter sp. AEG42_29 TaxID=2997339 RepID=A0AAU7AWR0_9ACTN
MQEVEDYATFVLDCEGHVANWNAGTRRFKGEAAEIVGRHFAAFS